MVTNRRGDSNRSPEARLAAVLVASLVLGVTACIGAGEQPDDGARAGTSSKGTDRPAIEHTLTADQSHSRFSRTIPPVLRVASGAVIEAYLQEASAGQLTASSSTEVRFNDRIRVPLRPFPGVMGVAPATDSLLSTIPPRANGGNMDNPYMTEGATVYFPVFVEGALFSIGDPHAAQGKGEVSGTAIEAPLRVVYRLELLKGARPIPEPQYETDEFYAVTAYATTLDEAALKATRYMIDYLVAEHGLEREEAYLLASIAGDLEIAEVVDMPHVLVAMHISKEVLGMR